MGSQIYPVIIPAMSLNDIFRRKRPRKLYFAVVIADRPTDGFKFTPDKDCKLFMVTGETTRGPVIPSTVLKEVAERFENPKLDGKITVTEKTL